MPFKYRLVIAVLWAVSLAVAAQWRPAAQAQAPGTEVRFVQTGTKDGTPVGLLTAFVGGKWVGFRMDPQTNRGEVIPLQGRR